MDDLPEPPAAPAAGQAIPSDADRDRIRRLVAAVDEIGQPTRYDDPDLPSWKDGSRIGDAAPVAQKGRPPMSSKATDDSARMLSGGFLTLCLGAAASAVLHFSKGADETVIITLCAAPPAAFLSLGALVKKIKGAIPPEVHTHDEGPVYQDQRKVDSKNYGLWAKTDNRDQ